MPHDPAHWHITPPYSLVRRGFTLVEMMIVVAIMAIAAALVIPRGSDAASRLPAAGRLLLADIDFARHDAITHSENLRALVIAPDGSGYHIATLTDLATPIEHPIERVPYVVQFGMGRAAHLQGVSISTDAAGSPPHVRFGTFGHVTTGQDVTITLEHGQQALSINIEAATGQPGAGQIITRP